MNIGYIAESLRDLYYDEHLSDEEVARLDKIGFNFQRRELTRAVVCFETGRIFQTLRDAARWCGVCSTSLIRACKCRNSAGGWHWYYASEPKPQIEDLGPLYLDWSRRLICMENKELDTTLEELQKLTGLNKRGLQRRIKRGSAIRGVHYWLDNTAYPYDLIFKPRRQGECICVETGEVFASVKDAAEQFGTTANLIRKAIKTKKKASGFHWCLGTEVPPYFMGQDKSNARSVICLETGEVFSSASEAARVIGRKPDGIIQAARTGGFCGDLHWYFANETKPPNTFFKRQRACSVRCLETNEIYATMSSAGKAVGVSTASIHQAVKNRTRAAGYHWERVNE